MKIKQKIEIAEVIILKWFLMDGLDKILRDLKINKKQARKYMMCYIKQKIALKNERR